MTLMYVIYDVSVSFFLAHPVLLMIWTRLRSYNDVTGEIWEFLQSGG